MVMTDRRGLHRPMLGAILLLLSSFPSTASVTDRHRHNGPSRVSFQNTSTLGIWVLDHLFYLHDEPAGRTVIAMTDRHKLRNPTWSDFPIFLQQLLYAATYGPSQARRTIISSVGGLFCIFSLKISAFSFGQISYKTKRNLYQN